jgi:hypothetical protein
LSEFRRGAIDIRGVLDRVSILFLGIPKLMQGLDIFLPLRYRTDRDAIIASAGAAIADYAWNRDDRGLQLLGDLATRPAIAGVA